MADRIQYRIIYSDSQERLAEAVNTAIEEGWRPQGGIGCAVWSQKNEREGQWDTHCEYSQAMIANIGYLGVPSPL